ncbi:glutaredoxin [bacterium]|nr:glutaredoxin [bacterium]
MLKIVRWILSKIILALDALFQPSPMNRSPEAQSAVDLQTQSLSLYQFVGCPFCVKVRRQIRRLGLTIELRDAQHDPKHREDLVRHGGELQVPCLRIEEQGGGQARWMYESDEINAYLTERFGAS